MAHLWRKTLVGLPRLLRLLVDGFLGLCGKDRSQFRWDRRLFCCPLLAALAFRFIVDFVPVLVPLLLTVCFVLLPLGLGCVFKRLSDGRWTIDGRVTCPFRLQLLLLELA